MIHVQVAKGSKAASPKQVTVRQLHKTPIITTFVALLAAVVLGNNMMVANGISYGLDGMPVSLSGDEFIIVRDTALSDPRVQELIDGRNYSITDCCGFYKDPTSSWQPVINIGVDNELQIGISVDLDTRKITGIETMPTIQHQVPRSVSNTAAEEVVKQSSNDGMTSIPFATNTITALPMILVIGIVLGGAAAGIFYYVKKGKNNATSREKR